MRFAMRESSSGRSGAIGYQAEKEPLKVSKDYYLILGVPRTESQRGIRKAFRDLVRKHHPDRAGPGGVPAFRTVVEAYEVLSDPARRQKHDAHLRERDTAAFRAPWHREARTRTKQLETQRLFRHPEEIRPSADAFLERALRNFTRVGLGKGEHPEPLLCDVALERDEAKRGGTLPICIPILSPCPSCHGTGHFSGFPCGRCDSIGQLQSEVVVPIDLPAGIPSGMILETPLDESKIHNLWLRTRIRVIG